MRKAILGTMLGLMATTPAHAERFAISCSGKSLTGIVINSTMSQPNNTKIKNVVYVIDEEARTVHRFIPKQNMLEEVCALHSMQCSRDFSAQKVVLSGSISEMRGEPAQEFRTVLSFDWDRKTNRVETVFDMFAANGVGMIMRWSLKCVPAPIPTITGTATGTTGS